MGRGWGFHRIPVLSPNEKLGKKISPSPPRMGKIPKGIRPRGDFCHPYSKGFCCMHTRMADFEIYVSKGMFRFRTAVFVFVSKV